MDCHPKYGDLAGEYVDESGRVVERVYHGVPRERVMTKCEEVELALRRAAQTIGPVNLAWRDALVALSDRLYSPSPDGTLVEVQVMADLARDLRKILGEDDSTWPGERRK